MLEKTRISFEAIEQRLSTIEDYLIKLVTALETQTSVKSLSEEISQLKKEVACLTDERTIFKKN